MIKMPPKTQNERDKYWDEIDAAEKQLLDAGFKRSECGAVTSWLEPRTNVPMSRLEAALIYRRHVEHGTTPIAVSSGHQRHADAVQILGQRDGFIIMPGTTPNLSVWFAMNKDAAQFLSRMGHARKQQLLNKTSQS